MVRPLTPGRLANPPGDTFRTAPRNLLFSIFSVIVSGLWAVGAAASGPPTDISLSASSVLENRAPHYTMGTLGTTDPDGGTFT